MAKGNFELDGVSYPLAENNNGNHLHGGIQGFHAVVWDVTDKNDNTVEFTRISPDMEEGYPGNLKVKVQYTLTDANELVMRYSAETDAPTVVNLTHHSFFNLKGEGEGDILDHVLQINADYFTPVDAGSIPLGEIRPVVDTPYDFNSPKAIGARIEVEDAQLQIGKGYDINYVLNDTPLTNEGLVFAAKVTSPSTGRVMEVFTNEPGIQLYTGNYLDGTAIGKSGRPYLFRGAICLETQHFPDSPNKKDFPSTVLRPGQTYGSSCIYKFSTLP
ncbi:MAG: aldose epimerase family protein [Bacteroidota bacterium]